MKIYDYIIIGGGTAGCVLANRLSCIMGHNILLIEAGNNITDQKLMLPFNSNKLIESSNSFKLSSIPQEHLNGRSVQMHCAKTLGGGSSIGYQTYIRGNKADYDSWKDFGVVGWEYEKALPYFIRAESQQNKKTQRHGLKGPMEVVNRIYTHPITNALLQATYELGYYQNDDFNDGSQLGFGKYQVNNKNGFRQSVASAYIEPIRDRKNIEIRLNTIVKKIIIQGGNAQAVIIQSGNKEIEIPATKEILLCAGAIHSPKILMQSGIGDAKALELHDIKICTHLPGVGKGLKDHFAVPLSYSLTKKSPHTLQRLDQFPYNFFNKIISNKMVQSNWIEAGGFVSTTPKNGLPDYMFQFVPAILSSLGTVSKDKGDGFTIYSSQIQPTSEGSVQLLSDNSDVPIAIDPNFISTDYDKTQSINAYKIAAKIATTKKMEGLIQNPILNNPMPQTDEEILEYIKNHGVAMGNICGTCRMGKGENAVVDSNLRVHGIPNLRVVDLSVLPNILRGSGCATAVMIAEKVSDKINKLV